MSGLKIAVIGAGSTYTPELIEGKGALTFMDYDDIIEISCNINKNGASPLPIKNFDNRHIIGMMKTIKSYEKHAVNASLHGDYQEALNALLIHPLAGDFEKLKAALDELMEANKEYLTQFYK